MYDKEHLEREVRSSVSRTAPCGTPLIVVGANRDKAMLEH